MINTEKIKYCVAVAAVTVATAFCGCKSTDEEVIPISGINVQKAGTVTEDADKKEGLSFGTDHEETATVYVCGAVRCPDVYTLPKDSRMIDAVNAAGGAADDAGVGFLNLASHISDGQKIYIPTEDEVEKAVESGELYGTVVNITANGVADGMNHSGNDGSIDNGMVNINTADRTTLMTLPGIGQSKADKIIAYREANGGFSCIEDIMLVGGIKEGLFNKVKDKICVR